MIAVIDETTPEVDGSILYTVVSAVLIADVAEARLALDAVLPDRKRPFHWNQEGPTGAIALRSSTCFAEKAGPVSSPTPGWTSPNRWCGSPTQLAGRSAST